MLLAAPNQEGGWAGEERCGFGCIHLAKDKIRYDII